MESVEVHQGSGQFSWSLYVQEELFLCRTLANTRDGPVTRFLILASHGTGYSPALLRACLCVSAAAFWMRLAAVERGRAPRARGGSRRAGTSSLRPACTVLRVLGSPAVRTRLRSVSGWSADGDRSGYRAGAHTEPLRSEHRASGGGSARRRLCSRGAPFPVRPVRRRSTVQPERSRDGAGSAAVGCWRSRDVVIHNGGACPGPLLHVRRGL